MWPNSRSRLSPCLGGSRFWELMSNLKSSWATFSWSGFTPTAAHFSLCFDRRVSEDIGESGGLCVTGGAAGLYWGLTGLTGTSTSSSGTTWTRSGMSRSSRRDSGECFSRSSSSLTESLRLLSWSRGPTWNMKCWLQNCPRWKPTKMTRWAVQDINQPRPIVPETVREEGEAKGNSKTCLGFAEEEGLQLFKNTSWKVFEVRVRWAWKERICLVPGERDLCHPGQHCPMLFFTCCLSPLTSLDTLLDTREAEEVKLRRGDERRGFGRVAKLKEKRLLPPSPLPPTTTLLSTFSLKPKAVQTCWLWFAKHIATGFWLSSWKLYFMKVDEKSKALVWFHKQQPLQLHLVW